jgi:hypothetical protein
MPPSQEAKRLEYVPTPTRVATSTDMLMARTVTATVTMNNYTTATTPYGMVERTCCLRLLAALLFMPPPPPPQATVATIDHTSLGAMQRVWCDFTFHRIEHRCIIVIIIIIITIITILLIGGIEIVATPCSLCLSLRDRRLGLVPFVRS